MALLLHIIVVASACIYSRIPTLFFQPECMLPVVRCNEQAYESHVATRATLEIYETAARE